MLKALERFQSYLIRSFTYLVANLLLRYVDFFLLAPLSTVRKENSNFLFKMGESYIYNEKKLVDGSSRSIQINNPVSVKFVKNTGMTPKISNCRLNI